MNYQLRRLGQNMQHTFARSQLLSHQKCKMRQNRAKTAATANQFCAFNITQHSAARSDQILFFLLKCIVSESRVSAKPAQISARSILHCEKVWRSKTPKLHRKLRTFGATPVNGRVNLIRQSGTFSNGFFTFSPKCVSSVHCLNHCLQIACRLK